MYEIKMYLIKKDIEKMLTEAQKESKILAIENYDIHVKKCEDRERIETLENVLELFEKEEI